MSKVSKTSKASKPGRPRRKELTFAYATKSFVGYLQGTERSLNTIRNYQADLKVFGAFLESNGGKKPELKTLTLSDLKNFQAWMKKRGLKTNSQRRRLMTIRHLMSFLQKRKKIRGDFSTQIPVPQKIERIPLTFSHEVLEKAVRTVYGVSGDLSLRNRLLLRLLLESGCQVHEMGRVRFAQFRLPATGEEHPQFQVSGKAPRSVPISTELFEEIQLSYRLPVGSKEVSKPKTKKSYLFLGHNKFGSLGSPISERGIELLVRDFSRKAKLEGLTPRVFRHSAVRAWYESGKDREEIQRRLGLKTAYAFRVYEPIFSKWDLRETETTLASEPVHE